MYGWRTILEHSFPDRHIKNARTAPGSWEFPPDPTLQLPIRKLEAFKYATDVVPGRWARYSMQPHVDDVVALDVSVDLNRWIKVSIDEYWGDRFDRTVPSFPWAANPPFATTVLKLGPLFELGLKPKDLHGPSHELTGTIGGRPFPPVAPALDARPHQIRAQWWSSGRFRVSLNGASVAQMWGVMPGVRLTIADVTIGHRFGIGPFVTSLGLWLPWAFELTRLSVAVFRFEDAAADIARDLKIDWEGRDNPSVDCLEWSSALLRQGTDLITRFVADLAEAEPAINSRRVAALHRYGQRFLYAVIAMVSDSGDQRALDNAIRSFERLVRIAQELDPTTVQSVASSFLRLLELVSNPPCSDRAVRSKRLQDSQMLVELGSWIEARLSQLASQRMGETPDV